MDEQDRLKEIAKAAADATATIFDITKKLEELEECDVIMNDLSDLVYKLGYIEGLSYVLEWEEYEEPKEYWYIGIDGEIYKKEHEYFNEAQDNIGNRFETKEEAEKAVEKLKAWKRLKDKGFKFIGKTYETDKRFGSIFYKVDEDTYSEDIIDALDICFGGEE